MNTPVPPKCPDLAEVCSRNSPDAIQRQLLSALETVNDAVYLRTLDGVVLYWNRGAERLFGWSADEAQGRKIQDLRDVEASNFALAEGALLAHGSWSGELKKTTKTGGERVVFCRWTLLHDAQGRPENILAISTDMTERKQLEASFLRAQRLESLGLLAGGIAHDLNNVLSPILMGSCLLRSTASDPESVRLLDMMQACAQRGAEITKQVLSFARGQPANRAPLPLRSLLKEIRHIVVATFPKTIAVRLEVADPLGATSGDGSQIHQALLNLCVNARDAMPNGGTLTLGAANVTLDEGAAARLPDASAGNYVALRVTDTGTGISPENMDRLFTPFFTTKQPNKGTGLGLAAVRSIAHSHGGFVRVDSRRGKGTSFELCLPVCASTTSSGLFVPEPLPPRASGELILLVDDEVTVRDMWTRVLEQHGYRVLAASEGAEALRRFAEHRAEVRATLTDIMMPGLSGLDLVRTLRQADPHLPIVAATGMLDDILKEQLAAAGVIECLVKPFQATTLLTAMHRALTRSRSKREAVSHVKSHAQTPDKP